MERFEVDLPPDLAQFVHSQVGQGTLKSDGDVMRDLVRQASELAAYRDEVRCKIATGVASLRSGRGVDGDTFMQALDADLAERETQRR